MNCKINKKTQVKKKRYNDRAHLHSTNYVSIWIETRKFPRSLDTPQTHRDTDADAVAKLTALSSQFLHAQGKMELLQQQVYTICTILYEKLLHVTFYDWESKENVLSE